MKYAEDMNYWDTTVHPAKSKGEIEEMLEDFGAESIITGSGKTSEGVYAWMIRFQWRGHAYRFLFTTAACRWPGKVMTYAGKKRTNEEQAKYQMARAAYWFVKAILTAADFQPAALFSFLELPAARPGAIPPVASELDVEELTGRLPAIELPRLESGE
jgi:hypothetical protein